MIIRYIQAQQIIHPFFHIGLVYFVFVLHILHCLYKPWSISWNYWLKEPHLGIHNLIDLHLHKLLWHPQVRAIPLAFVCSTNMTLTRACTSWGISRFSWYHEWSDQSSGLLYTQSKRKGELYACLYFLGAKKQTKVIKSLSVCSFSKCCYSCFWFLLI